MRKLLDDVFVSDTIDFVNIYYLREKDRFVMIDAGMEKDPSAVIEEIKNAGWSLSDLRGIIVTHAHPDHTGCAQALAGQAGCNIFISEEDNIFIHGAVSMKEGDKLPFFGGLEVILCPGHTDGSAALYQRERKLMFFGDQARVDENGVVNLSVPAHYNKDTAQALETVKRLISTHEIEAAFFGHGEPVLSNAGESLAKAVEPELP